MLYLRLEARMPFGIIRKKMWKRLPIHNYGVKTHKRTLHRGLNESGKYKAHVEPTVSNSCCGKPLNPKNCTFIKTRTLLGISQLRLFLINPKPQPFALYLSKLAEMAPPRGKTLYWASPCLLHHLSVMLRARYTFRNIELFVVVCLSSHLFSVRRVVSILALLIGFMWKFMLLV